MGTRTSWHPVHVDRDTASNERTMIVDLADLRTGFGETSASLLEPPPPFEELFARHYDAIRRDLDRHADEPGVLLFALDARGPQGRLWLQGDGELRTGIVGRHGRCDLFLPDDAAMSLRHLAILVRSREEADGRRAVRIRAVDLRTPQGFQDESGRHLRGVVADGPFFLTVSRTQLCALPTGDGRRWPDDPAEAWGSLPPRTFADSRDLADGGPVRGITQLVRLANPFLRTRRLGGSPETTTVTAVAGPLGSEQDAVFVRLARGGESVLGHLLLGAGRDLATLSIGAAAASRGVLLGRYERCDLPEIAKLRDDVSRVHALLVQDGTEIHLVDCASTNGTFVEGLPITYTPLRDGAPIRLGLSLQALWQAAT